MQYGDQWKVFTHPLAIENPVNKRSRGMDREHTSRSETHTEISDIPNTIIMFQEAPSNRSEYVAVDKRLTKRLVISERANTEL